MTDTLTNEQLSGICPSAFELTNYAIDLGRYYIRSGHETTLREVLKEVKRHPNPNYLETLRAIDEAEMREREEEGRGR